MKKTAILSVIAVLAAAAVIGTLASTAESSGFTVIQKNDQDQRVSGFAVFGSQFASCYSLHFLFYQDNVLLQ
jgi:hypothetical protein